MKSRILLLLVWAVVLLGVFSLSVRAAVIQDARDQVSAALQSVSDFNKQLDKVGMKAFQVANSCRNARALIAGKRANLNGLAVQAINKAIDQKEGILTLFPDLSDLIPLIGDKVQSTSDTISELTQAGTLNPFRSNEILDRLEKSLDTLPLMDNGIQSLSSKLSDDLSQAFDDALTALSDNDSNAARDNMNLCLSILRDFEKMRKVVGQAQRGKVTRLLTESKLLMRQTGPLRGGSAPLGKEDQFVALGDEAVAIQLRVYTPDGRLWVDREIAGRSLSWNVLEDSVKALANGVYLAVIGVRGVNGKLIRTEVKKFAIHR
ncbi:hypothetical protein HYR54_07995 [Candidatus Acetothermia bacterium]|nr:hypothetical protein [Candidatus Acetothermia bacterium]MBI3461011.1 hypothetical protein [Candidatus Acetothermia bacterium]